MSLHPAVAAVRRAVRGALVDVGPGEVVVVACSGGADSLALLAATVAETRRDAVRVVGAVVDHGLQEGSAEHTEAVVAQMARLGADETLSARVTVTGDGHGPEAAAREARYAVLGQVAQSTGARAVLLGHTLDDQAETVLLGLARGSGGRSLSGMRPAFDVFRRPLLDVHRAETESACAAEGIEVWHDPHNADPASPAPVSAPRCCRCWSASSGRGWPRPSPARPLSCAPTWRRSTPSPTRPTVRPGSRTASTSPCWRASRRRSGRGCSGSPRWRPVRRRRSCSTCTSGALESLVDGDLRGEVQLPGHVSATRTGVTLRFAERSVPR